MEFMKERCCSWVLNNGIVKGQYRASEVLWIGAEGGLDLIVATKFQLAIKSSQSLLSEISDGYNLSSEPSSCHCQFRTVERPSEVKDDIGIEVR